MNKIIIVIGMLILISVVASTGIYFFSPTGNNLKNNTSVSALDATYEINNEKITLINGISEESVSTNSGSKIITKYYGKEIKADLNNDGRLDSAFIVSQQNNDGIFYYLLALLNTINGSVSSKSVSLGGNVSPQTTITVKGNTVTINSNNQNSKSSTSTSSNQNSSYSFDSNTNQFNQSTTTENTEVDSVIASLGQKKWTWISTTYKEVGPLVINQFTLNLKTDGSFIATTDCNTVNGQYSVSGNSIFLNKMTATMVACDNTHSGDFINMLNDIQSFSFTSKNELILGLKSGDGAMLLK